MVSRLQSQFYLAVPAAVEQLAMSACLPKGGAHALQVRSYLTRNIAVLEPVGVKLRTGTHCRRWACELTDTFEH